MMRINRRLERMEQGFKDSNDIDHEKVEYLTALLRSLDGTEQLDLAKLSHDANVIQLAALLQRLDADKREYPG
jgi:hypothetical protein